MEKFPLLVKFIDANSNLSVQVHPNDEFAFKYENGEKGKTEMWYIMDCTDDAKIICGMRSGINKDDLSNILTGENVSDYLNYISVKKGDCIYIPSGTIHAILGGTLICEVQQNSDLTYRVYDWGRLGNDGKPRPLHIDKAVQVIDLENSPQICSTENIDDGENNIISSNYFKTNKITIKDNWEDTSSSETFYAINVVSGNGTLLANEKEYDIKPGDSFLIPAQLGKYKIYGKVELLKSFI